jgi:excisionase family DNA binding protein
MTTPTSDWSSEPLWTVKEVAAYLKVSTAWVYMHAEDGTLPSVRIGGLRRFHPEDIRAYARGEWKPAPVVPFPARGR